MGFTDLFGSVHERKVLKYQPVIDKINELELSIRKLTDRQLRDKTAEFRARLRKGQTLDDLLPEAFAVVREAAIRTIGLRHYDVQLIGGIVLHEGKIAEMKTGEGKTLVATLPLYLNALEGRGAHLVTVNDYLAERDAQWMGQIYRFLGMKVGVVLHGQSDYEKQEAYQADITYGTNSEFGFDYLRDNMKDSIERYAQRELHYAIVDEVDSILIDEARTPLIISGPAEQTVSYYEQVNEIIPFLRRDIDYTIDEKAHTVMLTDHGVSVVEDKLKIGNLYDPRNITWLHHVNTALKAHHLYKRDVNYLVENGKVIIIDEFTGRKMEGRRWSDGLHQAIEAKEHVAIEAENQTLATVTYQNFFRMYDKLAGMTGTAETESEEFMKIYNLDVVVIPTNKPVIRIDHEDVVYKNEIAKFRAVVKDIKERQAKGQPILVGTVSVEKTEVLSKMLKKAGVPHEVLNAKNHAREADIVAQAGRLGAVTISTNMAGRGTDILLGGNAEALAKAEVDPELDPDKYAELLAKYKNQCAEERERVLEAGGLHIIGTERHESRRIDNQLRGRAGRQGDPGSSRFFLSLEDDLMRVFGSDRLQKMMDWLNIPEDEPIEHKWVTRAIEDAQRRVEQMHFDIRKNLLEYDDVMDLQRKSIYRLRRHILEGKYYRDMTEDEIKAGKKPPIPEKSGQWTLEKLQEVIHPWVEKILDSLAETYKDRKYLEMGLDPFSEEGRAELPPLGFEDIDMEPREVTHELYRNFGAVVDLTEELKQSREACVEKATQIIAESLIQQRERILDLVDELSSSIIERHCPIEVHPEDWELEALSNELYSVFGEDFDFEGVQPDPESYAAHVYSHLESVLEHKEKLMGIIQFLFYARHFYLDEIDSQWIEHLKNMEMLRDGIGLRGYAQKDPKLEYKREGHMLFEEMLFNINRNVVQKLFMIQVKEEVDELPEYEHEEREYYEQGGGSEAQKQQEAPKKEYTKAEIRKMIKRIPRNGPCPCGSGKKYKLCHYTKDMQAANRGELPEWWDAVMAQQQEQ